MGTQFMRAPKYAATSEYPWISFWNVERDGGIEGFWSTKWDTDAPPPAYKSSASYGSAGFSGGIGIPTHVAGDRLVAVAITFAEYNSHPAGWTLLLEDRVAYGTNDFSVAIYTKVGLGTGVETTGAPMALSHSGWFNCRTFAFDPSNVGEFNHDKHDDTTYLTKHIPALHLGLAAIGMYITCSRSAFSATPSPAVDTNHGNNNFGSSPYIAIFTDDDLTDTIVDCTHSSASQYITASLRLYK